MSRLLTAAPTLASLDMDRTVQFYTEKLGFKAAWHDANYGIVVRDKIDIHFWKTDNEIFPKNTSCYIYVEGVDELYEEFREAGVIHPNGLLGDRDWGMREFAIVDVDGNLIRFGQHLGA